MAKRFDNSTEYLSTTSNLLNYNLPYTVMFWGKISVDTNDYIHFWASCATATESSGNYTHSDLVGTGSDGTTLTVAAYISGGTTSATGTNLTVGTWYHIALVRESTTVLKLYLNGVLNATSTTNISGRNSVAGEYMGRFNGAYPLNGCVDAFKSWNTALTSTEVQAEMNSRAHVKTASQYRNTTFTAGGSSLVDSINGYNWTANGTISDEAGPSQLDAISGSGSFKTSGSSTVSIGNILSGSGSAKVSGTGSIEFLGVIAGTGSAKLSGTSTVSQGYTISGSGTAKLTGVYSTGTNTGIDFPNNFESESAVRMQWSGADMVPRYPHSAIWKVRHDYQDGYYSVAWHTNDGAWDGGVYSYGTHPWPGNGLFNPSNGFGGESPGVGTGSGGTEHFYEIAGVTGADDKIRDETGVSLPIVLDEFRTQARTAKLLSSGPDSGMVEHLYWPDISQPTHYIRSIQDPDDIDVGSDPIFAFGASPWRDDSGGGTGFTDEALGGVLRGMKLFDDSLSITDITTEAASGTNSPVTSSGIASVWYMNENPTPDDITDKSGEGHDPVWANAYRPSLWEEPPSWNTSGTGSFTLSGTSTIVQSYTVSGSLSAKLAGTSTVNQDLVISGSTAGKVSGSGTVNQDITASGSTAAKVSGTSTVSQDFTASGSISAKLDSSSILLRDFIIPGALSGKFEGIGALDDVDTSIEVTGALSAKVGGSYSLSQDFTIPGDIRAYAAISSTPIIGYTFSGAGAAKVSGSGTVSGVYEFTGSIQAKASISSSVSVPWVISGSGSAYILGRYRSGNVSTNPKRLSIAFTPGETVYAIVKRLSDGFYLSNTDGSFAVSPADPYKSLTEDSIMSGIYAITESRERWEDGSYFIAYYAAVGSPDPDVDTLIPNYQLEQYIRSDFFVNDGINSDRIMQTVLPMVMRTDKRVEGIYNDTSLNKKLEQVRVDIAEMKKATAK